MLPVAFIVPDTFTPVPVTVTTSLPTALIVTLPLLVAIVTLLLPLLILDCDTDNVTQDRLPLPSVCRYWPYYQT